MEKLALILCLGLVARASAWARLSAIFTSEELGAESLADHLKRMQKESPVLGNVQLLGECCGQHTGSAVDVQTSINSNSLYGSTKEISKKVFNSSGCTPTTQSDREQKPKADCTYVAVFANAEFADNTYAANCVPAQVCKDDVMGKGLIATYGVVLQVMQPNLGSLVHLSEGPIERCYEGRDKINSGHLEPLLREKPIHLEKLVLGTETVLEIPGMEVLVALDTLSPCKNDPSVGYLYVHTNNYWSAEEQAIDLVAFTSTQEKEKQEKPRKAALEKAPAAVAKGDEDEAEEALQRAGALAPKLVHMEALDKAAKVESAQEKRDKTDKDREVEAAGAKAEKLELAAAPKLGHAGADPKVLGKRFHSDWNLPSISPVFCPCGKRCAKGRILGLWNYWCFRYECKKCPPWVQAVVH